MHPYILGATVKSKIYIGCLVIVAVLLFAGVSEGEPQNKQEQQKPATQHNEKVSSQPMSGLWTQVGNFLNDNSAAITAAAAILTVCATIAIAAFTIILARVSRRQAEITREAMIMDRRAFVAAIGINRYFRLDLQANQYKWTFRPILQNTGATPTQKMAFYTDCILRDTPLPPNSEYEEKPRNIGTGMIPPHGIVDGAGAPNAPDPEITAQNLFDVFLEKKYLYLWGWVKYNDVFPGTSQHITRFFWQIRCAGDPYTVKPGGPDLNFAFTQYAEGNCADDDCDNWPG